MAEKFLTPPEPPEPMTDRRSFLRGSVWAAAALAAAAAFPMAAAAQGQSPAPADTKKEEPKKDEPKKDDLPKNDEPKDGKKDEPETAKSGGQGSDKKEAPDPFKETRKDEKGRDYRLCPQCGFNMYRQDKTWTCENCGYSYSE